MKKELNLIRITLLDVLYELEFFHIALLNWKHWGKIWQSLQHMVLQVTWTMYFDSVFLLQYLYLPILYFCILLCTFVSMCIGISSVVWVYHLKTSNSSMHCIKICLCISTIFLKDREIDLYTNFTLNSNSCFSWNITLETIMTLWVW